MENIKSQLKTITNLDKSTWNVVRFGDVAIQQKESVDRENTDLTRYVAGNHMQTNDLHIRQWGEFDGSYVGPAFHRKFEKGDILYGSRRTYLRKVAVAEFDGITANTTYVMKANKELIEPALLPFILLSESFAQHSIQNSKGSTNPYINWKDIDWYQFKLPPREMQKKLAELLWSMDEAEESRKKSFEQCKLLRETLLNNLLSPKHKDNKNIYVRLGDYIKLIQYGYTASASYNSNGVKFLRITDIQDNKVDWKSVPYCDCDVIEKYKLENGDIVFARTGATTGKSYFIKNPPKSIFASYLIRVRVSDQFIPEFVYLFFQTRDYWRQISSLTTGSAQGGFNASKLANLKIVCPGVEKQKEVIEELSVINRIIDNFETSLNRDKEMKFSLINLLF